MAGKTPAKKAPAKKKAEKETTLEVVEFNTGKVEFCILGKTPFIAHSMSAKARGELLFPKGRKTQAEKAASLKHNPYQEFRDSPYKNTNPKAATYIEHLATCFKQCIRSAALDIPGTTKAELGRLLWVEGERVSMYGIPQIFLAVTRSADMNRTPDIRTRAILPEWACKITVSFMQPKLNVQVIANLLSIAGLTQGMGDWRPQKGSGNYGQFEVCNENDKQYQRIIKSGGYAAQVEAMQNPVAYDNESESLLSWFDQEVKRRGTVLTAVS